MLLRQSPTQACPDRKDHCIGFRDSINRIALTRKAESWESPISTYYPIKIPFHKSDADTDQLCYAADIIEHFDPSVVIEQTKYDDEISCYHNSFDLNIDAQDWKFAYNMILAIYKQEVEKFEYMMKMLDIFSTSAFRGDICCRTQHRSTLINTQIDRHVWNADKKALWSRYVHGTMNIARPGDISTENDDIILVDAGGLEKFIVKLGVDIEEMKKIIAKNLRAAAAVSPRAAPEGGRGPLVAKIAAKTLLTIKEAELFLDSTVGHDTWRIVGRPQKGDEIAAKELRVIPMFVD